MDLNFPASTAPLEVFNAVSEYISRTMRISHIDSSRPWGGFMVINDDDLPVFLYSFFPEIDKQLIDNQKISPKVLLVAPGKRLSWQYHHRRAEIWKTIGGVVGVVRSNDDDECDNEVLQTGEQIEIKVGERHRLVGLQEWGIVAEIWRHTDPSNPSNEDDIVRVQDDFCR